MPPLKRTPRILNLRASRNTEFDWRIEHGDAAGVVVEGLSAASTFVRCGGRPATISHWVVRRLGDRRFGVAPAIRQGKPRRKSETLSVRCI